MLACPVTFLQESYWTFFASVPRGVLLCFMALVPLDLISNTRARHKRKPLVLVNFERNVMYYGQLLDSAECLGYLKYPTG